MSEPAAELDTGGRGRFRHQGSTFRSRTSLAVVLLLAACSGGDGTGPDPHSGPILTGRVHAVGGESVAGLRAVWRPRASPAADSARVTSDGSFKIPIASEATHGELLIDGPGPRTFHPFLFPFHTAEVSEVDILLIPRRWTVRSGTHAGQVVPTPLDPAVQDDVDQLRYTYFWAQPEPFNTPVRLLLDLMTWPSEHLPAHVAFDHEASAADLSADDSAAVWAVLGEMEEAVGEDLFQPVEVDPTWWVDPDDPDASLHDQPPEPGVIRVVHDPPTWGGLPQTDEEARVHDTDLSPWADTGPFTAFRESHTRLSAGLLLLGELEPLRLADGMVPWETVLVHEMAHVLGLGHTCRIPSPMGPCLRTPGLSPHDVAYMEMLGEALERARALETPHGIAPSVIGERRVLLGSSALPDLGR